MDFSKISEKKIVIDNDLSNRYIELDPNGYFIIKIDSEGKQIILEQDDDPNFQKRQDKLTPGKNPDAFYGPGSFFQKMKQKGVTNIPSGNKSQESMSNTDIGALQKIVGEYSLNKILNTIAVIADRVGKNDEADMIKKLADKIQDFDLED